MTKPKTTKIDLDSQYRCPSGIVGRRVGREMARDHLPENLWTIRQLNPQPADRILEVGFGPGVAIKQLATFVTEGLVAAVDYSMTMVQEASKRNMAAIKLGRVDLRHSDAAALPFADASFDKAFSVHAIYFWSKPLNAVKELHRVLKPPGLLAITVLPKESWPPNAPGSLWEYGTPECIPYSGGEIAQMLNAAGFSSIRIESNQEPARLSNFSVLGVK